MIEFELLIAADVFDFLSSHRRAVRQRLRDRFDEICDAPEQCSDYQQQDSNGRQLDVNICGRFAIAYWIDHADKHLKILEIWPADKAPSMK